MTAAPTAYTTRRAQDRNLARAARALDAEADRELRSDPELAALLAARLAALDHRATTRRLPRRVAHDLARERAAIHPAAERARRAHAAADALYWQMVLAWSRLIQREAFRLAQPWRLPQEDVEARLRLAWFEAAIQYDPDHEAAFDRWAYRCQLAHVPEGGPPKRPKPAYEVSLDELLDAIESEERAPPAAMVVTLELDDAIAHDQVMARVRDALDVLSDREAEVLRQRTEEDATLAEVGHAFRLSTERIRQIERGALVKLREELTR